MTLHPTARHAAPRPATPNYVETLIVGGGPGGTALLIAATRLGLMPRLGAAGLAIVERGPRIGSGALGGYSITSDSTAETFLTCVKGNPEPAMAGLAAEPAVTAIEAHVGGLGVPLTKVGAYLDRVGETLHALVQENGGAVLTGHEVIDTQRADSGLWLTRLKRLADGAMLEFASRNVVMATGGHQPRQRMLSQEIAGTMLGVLSAGRLMSSDKVLALGGLDLLRERLPARAPRIAIIGGSTSAVTAANAILNHCADLPLNPGAVTLLHRRPLRLFYPSAAAAIEDGYADFGPDDICPVSKFVYRLGGFRLEARELIRNALGVGGRQGDPRLRLFLLPEHDAAEAREIIETADIVVGALGYRPRALEVRDAHGAPIRLASHGDGAPALVDGACRVLDGHGQPLPGLFGIGLSAGFVPHGKFGGEKSFSGQANGLWLWQNDVGAMILDQLSEAVPQSVAA